jgi:hypothetical protein
MGPERITANLGFLKTFESQRSRRLSSRIDSPLGTKRVHHKIIDLLLKLDEVTE